MRKCVSLSLSLSHQAGPGHEEAGDDKPVDAVSYLPGNESEEL